ncbi:unnamed protein product [Parajaminaea phylloscopi]
MAFGTRRPSEPTTVDASRAESFEEAPSPVQHDEKLDSASHRDAKHGLTTGVAELGVQAEEPAGAAKFHKMSWIRLTSVLIVEAIALGSLSMPASFATIGLVPAILLTIGLGCVAYVCSLAVGGLWLKHPELTSYPLAGELLFVRIFGERSRKIGFWFTTICWLLLLIFTTGSHSLTGKLAFNTLSNDAICQVGFSGIAAIILFLLALPKTFNEMGFLGYIDFTSIVCAIGITIVASGIAGHKQPGGLDAVEWYAFLPKDKQPTFAEAFLSVTNITFAFAFAHCQFSFMAELKRPKEFKKSVALLVGTEMFIYVMTGALIYVFSGQNVKSPAFLGLSNTVAKVAFGVALPVIFISGSINTTTAGRFVYDRMYRGTRHEFMTTVKGNISWILLILVGTIIAWVIAEAVPVFSALLGLISSAFLSMFIFFFPAVFWLVFLRGDSDTGSWRNRAMTALHTFIALMAVFIFVAGIYASAMDIKSAYAKGTVATPFSCKSS